MYESLEAQINDFSQPQKQMTNIFTDIDDLIERVVEFTHSPESRGFYQKAIRILGLGQVEEAMGEVKMRYAQGAVDSKAKYLTTLLKDWMTVAEEPDNLPKGDNPSSNIGSNPINYDKSQAWLGLQSLDELQDRSLKTSAQGENKNVLIPYSTKWLQWARFVNNDFFALSVVQPKDNWDRVETRLRVDGKVVDVSLIRGKTTIYDTGRGVLTVEHARILGAVEHIWVQSGGPHTEVTNKETNEVTNVCYCDAPVRKIATLLGITNFGGGNMKHLVQKISDLDKTGYVFQKDDKWIGFKFMWDVSALGDTKSGEVIFRFVFSEAYSRQLLSRKVVSRPLDLLKIRGEIAFKIYQHIYPILMKKEKGEKHITSLSDLTEKLGLPKAGWHKFKSSRKRQFLKAISEINDKSTPDKNKFSVSIEEGKDDFVLVARMIGEN